MTEDKREQNRKRWPDLAEFIDELRAAGFDEARVVKVEWPTVANNGDTC